MVAVLNTNQGHVHGCQTFKSVVVFADVDVVGIGKRAIGVGMLGVATEEARQFLGLLHMQRLQHKSVDQAEHRAIGADS